jgi:hypothetical protein
MEITDTKNDLVFRVVLATERSIVVVGTCVRSAERDHDANRREIAALVVFWFRKEAKGGEDACYVIGNGDENGASEQ